MKKSLYALLVALTAVTTVIGCKDEDPNTAETPTATQTMTTQPATAQPIADHSAINQHIGTVVEVINTGRYTYVQADTGSKQIWAVTPKFQVKAGDKVIIPQGALMKNFHSKTLNRTFDLVYFVSHITVGGPGHVGSQLSPGHPKTTPSGTGTPALAAMDFSGIEKPEGGKTIAELYAEKANISGKEIIVRGKVVKFNSGIMGKNWIHLKDGTGAEGASDLTITTTASARVGDTVLASGVVVTDKDYGYGYKYAIIIEDASVTVE